MNHMGSLQKYLNPHVGLEGAYQLRRGVPGIRMRPPDLGLAQVLVVCKHMGQWRRNRGVQHGVHADVKRGRAEREDVDVLVPDSRGGGRYLYVVPHQGVVPVMLPGPCIVARSRLRRPVESPGRQHNRYLVALGRPPHIPRHEPIGKARLDRLPAEGDVVAVDELRELVVAQLAVDLAVQPLRHARRLHYPQALARGNTEG